MMFLRTERAQGTSQQDVLWLPGVIAGFIRGNSSLHQSLMVRDLTPKGGHEVEIKTWIYKG